MRMVLVAAILSGGLGLVSASLGGDLEVGKKVYEQKCASCHGADGKGNAKMEQALKVKIPDLTAGPVKADADLLKIISEGKRPMPSFGKSLKKDELQGVVGFTKSLAKGTK